MKIKIEVVEVWSRNAYGTKEIEVPDGLSKEEITDYIANNEEATSDLEWNESHGICDSEYVITNWYPEDDE